jgi:hypothetical protein
MAKNEGTPEPEESAASPHARTSCYNPAYSPVESEAVVKEQSTSESRYINFVMS